MSNAQEMIAAIQTANAEKVRQLLAENPGLAASRDESGVSALMHAIYRRQTDCITWLQGAGLSLDIFEAASLGALDCVRELLARDASLAQAYSPDGFTALHLAAYFSQPAVAKFLLDHDAELAAVAKNPTLVMPLHSAVSSNNLETVRDLIQHGALVNARQQHGWTPLHAAAQNGNLEIVEILLQNGADPRSKNEEGVTALDLAQKQNRTEVANRLAVAESVEESHVRSSFSQRVR